MEEKEKQPEGPRHIELKILPEYFSAVTEGVKTFEARKNDRDYKVGDVLILREWSPVNGKYTNRYVAATIIYMLMGGRWGIEPGYCVMGIRPVMEIKANGPANDKITVCDKCGRACCWQRYFMCDDAATAGTVQKTRAELKESALEAPDWWYTNKELADGKGR